jgi:hypothetical protein
VNILLFAVECFRKSLKTRACVYCAPGYAVGLQRLVSVPVCQGWEHGRGIFQIKSCRFDTNATKCVNRRHVGEWGVHTCGNAF